MEQLLEQIKSCLRRQIEAHEALAPLLDEERRALVGIDLAAIHRCLRSKGEWTEQVRLAEAERQRAVSELMRALGLGERVPRLSELIDLLPAGERAEFRELRERLIWAVAAVHEGQSRNRSLAQRFQGVLQRSMTAVQEALASLPLYTTGAKLGHARMSGCVLSQQA